jgi:hypothetical protein
MMSPNPSFQSQLEARRRVATYLEQDNKGVFGSSKQTGAFDVLTVNGIKFTISTKDDV